MIQTWTGKRKEVKLDLKAHAMKAGKLGPSFETSRDHQGNAISMYANENYGGRVVVFCDGLRYSFKRWKGPKYQVCSVTVGISKCS